MTARTPPRLPPPRENSALGCGADRGVAPPGDDGLQGDGGPRLWSRRGVLFSVAGLASAWLAGDAAAPGGLRWAERRVWPGAEVPLWVQRDLRAPGELWLHARGPAGEVVLAREATAPARAGQRLLLALDFPPLDPEPGEYVYWATWRRGRRVLAHSDLAGYALAPFAFGC